MIRMKLPIFLRFRDAGGVPASSAPVEMLWDEGDTVAWDDLDLVAWD